MRARPDSNASGFAPSLNLRKLPAGSGRRSPSATVEVVQVAWQPRGPLPTPPGCAVGAGRPGRGGGGAGRRVGLGTGLAGGGGRRRGRAVCSLGGSGVVWAALSWHRGARLKAGAGLWGSLPGKDSDLSSDPELEQETLTVCRMSKSLRTCVRLVQEATRSPRTGRSAQRLGDK